MKICKECNQDKSVIEYYRNTPYCKPCIALRYKRKTRTQKDKDRNAKASNKYYHKKRRKVVAHYGNKCVCCGEDEYTFLIIDHINGGGTAQRRSGIRGPAFLNWIVANEYPDTLRILCHNCNHAVKVGECPHEQQ